MQALFAGKVEFVEQNLSIAFRSFIGADTPNQDKSDGVKINWNNIKKVFQASVNVGTHWMVKEFQVKADAQHWADLVHSLQTSGKFKGHCSVIQKAEANRKTTQAAYDQIMSGKGVFSAEDNPNFQNDPKLGKDVWPTMFSRYQEPKQDLPSSEVRVHKGSLEEITVMGSKQYIEADLLGWRHKTLGWRVTHILHHTGQKEAMESVMQHAADLDLVRVGFIRCTGDSSKPEFTDSDMAKLKSLSSTVPEAVAVIVGYEIVTGVMRSWTPSKEDTGPGLLEVKLGLLSRRIEGEKILVGSAISKPSWKETLDAKIQDYFHKQLSDRLQQPEQEEISRFKKIQILGDGNCFWRCFLFSSLFDNYLPVQRNPGGGAKNQ